MKFAIPEISWHNRDPVLSVDFQPKRETNGPLRLATGGTDSHVLIWYVSSSENGSVNLEVAADLTRHQKAVNVVRWSPNGQYLASGDDESIIFVWQQKTEKDPVPADPNEEQYKETWVIYKTLRGHLEDVLDISWSPNSAHLISGSVDNKLIVWDVQRGKYNSILTDHKGFVQGVAWDPKNQFIASASTDRVFRTFDITTKKVTSRSSKATLPFPSTHPLHNTPVRLYHDDTLQTYYRRLQFSPDGLLIAVPAGRIEPEIKLDMKPIHAVYIYTRYSLKVPACIVPCGDSALVVRWSPALYTPRPGGPPPAFPAPRRMLLGVATRRSVMVYDTQQKTPIAVISNIHYTRLTDLTWSPDGRVLVASSTDGFCSLITFGENELGELLPEEPVSKPTEQMEVDQEPIEAKTVPEKPAEPTPPPKPSKIDAFMKFKAPTEKSPKKRKVEPEEKTPVKIDLLVETAMQSWSDNSNNEVIKPQSDDDSKSKKDEIMVIEDSEDIKLVYEETEGNKSSESEAKSSPENAKKGDEKPQSSSDKSDSKVAQTSNVKSDKVSPPAKDVNSFLKQAKVTDIKAPVAVATGPSPKAPRRVNFVTLSSPKTMKAKKKL